MNIQKYASLKNGSNPGEWAYNMDTQKSRYGRLLFVKQNKVLLMRRAGKPWKLPGKQLGHLVDQDEALRKWSMQYLGIRIDQYSRPLGLFTIGFSRGNVKGREYRETLVTIPAFWMENRAEGLINAETQWFDMDLLPEDTSFATRDFLEDYANADYLEMDEFLEVA